MAPPHVNRPPPITVKALVADRALEGMRLLLVRGEQPARLKGWLVPPRAERANPRFWDVDGLRFRRLSKTLDKHVLLRALEGVVAGGVRPHRLVHGLAVGFEQRGGLRAIQRLKGLETMHD